jgi:hypothetical protein
MNSSSSSHYSKCGREGNPNGRKDRKSGVVVFLELLELLTRRMAVMSEAAKEKGVGF